MEKTIEYTEDATPHVIKSSSRIQSTFSPPIMQKKTTFHAKDDKIMLTRKGVTKIAETKEEMAAYARLDHSDKQLLEKC